jgi:hypothetical protein
MKKLLFVLCLLQNLALAGGVPDCLKDGGVDSNQNRIIQGGYTVALDTTNYSSPELLAFLKQFAGNQDIYAKDFPNVYQDKLSFDVGPQMVSSNEPFASIQNRVMQALEKIQSQPGATVQCEFFAHPNPSSSGGT